MTFVSEQPSESTTTLVRFVQRVTALLERVARDLAEARGLTPAYRAALQALIDGDVIANRGEEILTGLRRPPGDEADWRARLAELRAHGLEEGSLELNLKMAAFQSALERSRYREVLVGGGQYDPEHDDVDSSAQWVYEERRKAHTETGLVDLVESTEAVWKTVNSILDSIKSVIPPAGVLAEIKEAIEAGITMLKDRMHAWKLAKRTFNKLRRRKHGPEPVGAGEEAPA